MLGTQVLLASSFELAVTVPSSITLFEGGVWVDSNTHTGPVTIGKRHTVGPNIFDTALVTIPSLATGFFSFDLGLPQPLNLGETFCFTATSTSENPAEEIRFTVALAAQSTNPAKRPFNYVMTILQAVNGNGGAGGDREVAAQINLAYPDDSLQIPISHEGEVTGIACTWGINTFTAPAKASALVAGAVVGFVPISVGTPGQSIAYFVAPYAPGEGFSFRYEGSPTDTSDKVAYINAVMEVERV